MFKVSREEKTYFSEKKFFHYFDHSGSWKIQTLTTHPPAHPFLGSTHNNFQLPLFFSEPLVFPIKLC